MRRQKAMVTTPLPTGEEIVRRYSLSKREVEFDVMKVLARLSRYDRTVLHNFIECFRPERNELKKLIRGADHMKRETKNRK